MSADVREIVTEYVHAVGDRRFDRFEELLHPEEEEVEFGGTTVAELRGASVVAEGYRRLGPIILRGTTSSELLGRRGPGGGCCHDFVTDTEAKAVLAAEFLTIEDGIDPLDHAAVRLARLGRRCSRSCSGAGDNATPNTPGGGIGPALHGS